MDIEIVPHVGAGPFRLGMSFDEAMQVAHERGTVKHGAEGERPPGKYVVKQPDTTLNFVLIFEADEKLDGIELWRFLSEDEDVHVTLDGFDVFRTPKKELRRRIEGRGHVIDYNDLGFDGIPTSTSSSPTRAARSSPPIRGPVPRCTSTTRWWPRGSPCEAVERMDARPVAARRCAMIPELLPKAGVSEVAGLHRVGNRE